MSNELVSLTSLPMSPIATGALAKYSASTEFLKRVQLVTKGKYVDKGKIKPGHYGVPVEEDEIQDLGPSIDVLPLAVREKALDTNQEPPLAVFDPEDPVYQDIVARSSEVDSGCMYGPSFLLFERTTGNFYEFFCGNKSARAEAGKFAPFMPVSEEAAKAYGIKAQAPQPLTLRSKYIERPRYSWHVPEVTKCSTPFTNLPKVEVIVDQVNKFLNPQKNEVEKADEKTRSR